ncbi:MAG: hypothetical protein GX241_02685 [Ruminococcaceae bacterium]|nr:hypothetical protein [Oscillospiraceae bacterium]
MAGLNKIIERIAQDSAAKCDGIIFDAQSEATKIKTAAIELAEKDKQAVIDKANYDAKALVDMAEGGAELEERKFLLATKVELINKAIELAVQKLKTMPDDEYFAAIYALAKKYAQDSDGIMFLSKKDLGRIPADFEKKVNDGIKGKIVVSKEARDISEGFILVYGEIEINCTFDALIADQSEDIKDELNKIIFA